MCIKNMDWKDLTEKYHEKRCFQFFKPLETRVVMIGQDPYSRNSTGLAFESEKETTSIKTMKKELERTGFKFTSISHWAEQGFLMLNSSFEYPWKHFHKESEIHLKKILEYLDENCSGIGSDILFVFIGKKAQMLEKYVKKSKKLSVYHPSGNSHYLFYNNSCFLKISEHLNGKIDY